MNIAQLRLFNQHIASHPFTRPADVVASLGALQGQDYTGTLWAIGLRMLAATEQGIEQALAAAQLVRTWPMRGTLHIVAAQDVRWLLQLLTPRMITQTAGRYRQLELDQATFTASQQLLVRVLRDGQHQTREELYQQLEQANIATTGQRGYHLLVRAAQDGLICFGVPKGNQQTFTLLDEWIAPTKPRTRTEGLAELARRYVTSHGPATLQDLMRWAGITKADATTGLADAAHELREETIDGVRYWMPPSNTDIVHDGIDLHLLPGFDEYLLGYANRDIVLDPAHAQAICPGGNGVFYPTIVINGRVAGTWKRAIKKNTLVITIDPFQPLNSEAYEALQIAAERYALFLGLASVRVEPS
jgi:hypothetical protein